MDWGDFFNMGGYAFHVWTSWGLSIGTIVTIVISGKRKNAKIKAQLAAQFRREAKINSDSQKQ